ncbi:MAG TPA: FRG domain-containing protein [Longimicrobiales bacterium]|nr:FRG domain-containing protein [Longimicrobiales bacterium]
MEDTTVRADSWSDLDELLFAGSWNERLQRFRATHAFRGVGRTTLDLRHGLARLGGDYPRKERHLLRNFRKYARRSFVGDDSIWNWLALAQHHGLPTRLLDWSYSPHVALHFATAFLEQMDVDGEVLVVNFERVAERLPDPLRELLVREGSFVFTGEMLSQVAASLGELCRLADEPFALFLEPPSLNERIINQAALFSLISHADVMLEQWLAAHPGTCRRIVVPAALKWEVRDKLDQINISERVLLPGLDGLSDWLRRYYFERPGGAQS